MSLESDVKVLQRVPMLSDFSEDKLRLLAFSAESRSFRDGQRLFSVGDRADSAYVIATGTVLLYGPGATEGEPLDVVRSGRLIGELAMIVEGERHSTAIAKGDVSVIQIRRPLFRRMLDEYPEVAQRLHARIATSLVDTTRAFITVKDKLDRIDD